MCDARPLRDEFADVVVTDDFDEYAFGPAMTGRTNHSAYFGDPWPSGICDHGRRTRTPAGECCMLCEEEIEANDQGFFRTVIMAADDIREFPQHRECGLREVLGGIGHLEDHDRWCRAVGDPDGGRSYRQSALEVWAWVAVHGDPPPAHS